MKYRTTSAERTLKILDRFIYVSAITAFGYLAYEGAWVFFIGAAISSIIIGTVLFWRMRLKNNGA